MLETRAQRRVSMPRFMPAWNALAAYDDRTARLAGRPDLIAPAERAVERISE